MNILVVYSGFTKRPTLLEGLLAFEKYSNCNVIYLNTRLPLSLQGVNKSAKFDLIIFSTLFFSRRSSPSLFLKDAKMVEWLKYIDCTKIVTPQDEYQNNYLVNDFIEEFGVHHVFTVQPPNVWDVVYPNHKVSDYNLHGVLTGYIDDQKVKEFSYLKHNWKKFKNKDFVYRTTGIPPYWYGRHAMLKTDIAYVFSEKLKNTDFTYDIAVDPSKTISSDKWYQFLQSSRFTIGSEGGTSICDYDGQIANRTESYLRKHPNASFEEVEQACFEKVDNAYAGYALSPRHLEACLTFTVQFLTEGDYSGVLHPWKHYIPIKKDFSDVSEKLKLIEDIELMDKIAETAYQEVIESGRYLLSDYVNFLISFCPPRKDPDLTRLGLLQRLLQYNCHPNSSVLTLTLVLKTILKKIMQMIRK